MKVLIALMMSITFLYGQNRYKSIQFINNYSVIVSNAPDSTLIGGYVDSTLQKKTNISLNFLDSSVVILNDNPVPTTFHINSTIISRKKKDMYIDLDLGEKVTLHARLRRKKHRVLYYTVSLSWNGDANVYGGIIYSGISKLIIK
jgi:hypothetical protein